MRVEKNTKGRTVWENLTEYFYAPTLTIHFLQPINVYRTKTVKLLNISSQRADFSHFCWLLAENSSNSSRVIPYFSATFSAVIIM